MIRYIKIKNNQPTNYSIDQLLVDYPSAIIYKVSQLPDEELLKNTMFILWQNGKG
jgi:hypothetical protein